MTAAVIFFSLNLLSYLGNPWLKGRSNAWGSTRHVARPRGRAVIDVKIWLADDSVSNARNKSDVTSFNKRVELSAVLAADFFYVGYSNLTSTKLSIGNFVDIIQLKMIPK